MMIKFASIKQPEKYGYIYDSDAWDSNSRTVICQHFQQFETYGDDLIQHSGEWTVQHEFLADYLASLTAAMLKDPELATAAMYDVTRRPEEKAIAFAASVVFKPRLGEDGEPSGYENKPRWFSMQLRKILSTPSKQYDKRYQAVEPWCDGSAGAIYRMLIPEYASGLEYFQYAEAIRNWCMAADQGERPYFYGSTAGQFLKWFDEKTVERARELQFAFQACQAVCESYRLRAMAAEYEEQNDAMAEA